MTIKMSPTELNSKNHPHLDDLSCEDALSLMLKNQSQAINAVKKILKDIEISVKSIHKRLSKFDKGRLIFCGAGTSARIAVQDGVELKPTFDWKPERLGFIIAGGKNAMHESVEGSEDNIKNSIAQVKKLKINKQDVVIGLAASGSTPFTKSVLYESRKRNALTVGIVNNPYSDFVEIVDHFLLLNTGPEVIMGSTRLKAGTSQKICLNLISTMLMVLFGRIKEGQMIFMKPTNKKLNDRFNRINKVN